MKIYLKFVYVLKSYVYLAIISDDFFIVTGFGLLVEANILSDAIPDTPTIP